MDGGRDGARKPRPLSPSKVEKAKEAIEYLFLLITDHPSSSGRGSNSERASSTSDVSASFSGGRSSGGKLLGLFKFVLGMLCMYRSTAGGL